MSAIKKSLKLEGVILEIRSSDNFINATKLCRIIGKHFCDWKRKTSSQKIIKELEKIYSNDTHKVIDINMKASNSEKGTWIHPKLVIPYVQWCLPKNVEEISKLITSEFKEKNSPNEILSDEKNVIIEQSNKVAADNIFNMVNQAFMFESKQVRTFIVKEAIWFCGKDVAVILEYKDTDYALRTHVRNRNKKILDKLLEFSRPGEISGLTYNAKQMVFINEPGLYSLIMKSKQKIAEQFQDWVTDEVLPSIRKIGQEKYLKQLAQLQLEQEKQQLLLQEKEEQERLLKEELFAKNQLISKQMDDNFWIMATNKNNLTLKKYGKLSELFYLGGIKHKARQDIYNNKAGISIRCETRDSELSTGSSPNSPFESVKFTLPEGSEQMFENYIHSLLDPFNIKKSRTQKDRKKGAKEHFMIPNAWMLYFIQKARENHISLVEEVNELIDLVEKNNMNFDKINEIISDMFEEVEEELQENTEEITKEEESGEESPLEAVEKLEDQESLQEEVKEIIEEQDTNEKEEVQIVEVYGGKGGKRKISGVIIMSRYCNGVENITDAHACTEDKFSINPLGQMYWICDECLNHRLEKMKQEVLNRLDNFCDEYDIDDDDQVKLDYLRININFITPNDMFKKKTIVDIGKYRRCAINDHHLDELSHWVESNKFATCKNKLKTTCKSCFNIQERNRRKNTNN